MSSFHDETHQRILIPFLTYIILDRVTNTMILIPVFRFSEYLMSFLNTIYYGKLNNSIEKLNYFNIVLFYVSKWINTCILKKDSKFIGEILFRFFVRFLCHRGSHVAHF